MTYYLKKHWKINSLVFILQILWAALSVMQNVVLIYIFQSVFDLDFKLFIFWSVVDVAVCAIHCLLDVMRSWAKARAIRSMNNTIRADITATLLSKMHQAFHAQQSGEYLSWYTNDINHIKSMAWNSFFDLISLITQIALSIAALASLHWSLIAFSVLVALLIIQVPKLFEKYIEQLSKTCAVEQASATSKLKDLLAGLDVLRSFGRVGRFMTENQKASDQLEQPVYRMTYMQVAIGNVIAMVSVICQMTVLALTGYLSIQGVIIQSAIAGSGNLCSTVYNGLTQLGQLRLSLKAAKPYFEKITVHADALDTRAGTASAPVENAITVENLTFAYGDKPVLVNADFRFEKGGKYALTGPSGCGKSTLLKLLLGWLPDYSGTIRFDGKDARDFTPDQLQRQMSYIEQDVFLFNTTIRENITLGGDFTDEQLRKALHDSALESDLAAMPLGLDTPVGEDGSSLSGGQKQRVAIARALIHDRSILLVDEGTSALDQKNADIVEKSLLSNPDLTLILVSHHLTGERKKQFTNVFQLNTVA